MVKKSTVVVLVLAAFLGGIFFQVPIGWVVRAVDYATSSRDTDRSKSADIEDEKKKAEQICALYGDEPVCKAFAKGEADASAVNECFISPEIAAIHSRPVHRTGWPIFNDYCELPTIALDGGFSVLRRVEPPKEVKIFADKVNPTFVAGLIDATKFLLVAHFDDIKKREKAVDKARCAEYGGDFCDSEEDTSSTKSRKERIEEFVGEFQKKIVEEYVGNLPDNAEGEPAFQEARGLAIGFFNTNLSLSQKRDEKVRAKYEPKCREALEGKMPWVPNYCSL